ncbi:diphthine synthase [Candidatus Woesearchaeota archaeon]|nr:diphthine synthase [Candidatus Woesearchaeota archaeon]
MLTFIGLGLWDEKDITVKGLEAVKNADYVYLESYTGVLGVPVSKLKRFYMKDIILASRTIVEQEAEEILDKAENKNVVFLVVGDPFAATTHTDLLLRAIEKNIECKIVHNASIFSAISGTGLQLYKFGRTTSLVIPEKNWNPETAYDAIKENKENGLHTLVLLDIKIDFDRTYKTSRKFTEDKSFRFMKINDAVKLLLEIESRRGENVFEAGTMCLGCARLGSNKQIIKYAEAQELEHLDFGEPLHCLIVPGELHFMEEKVLELFK